MSTVAKNLQTLYNIKDDIKTSLEKKGVEVGDIPFTDYSSKINDISTDIMVAEGIRFYNTKWENIPEKYNFSGVTDLSYMFHQCRKLKKVNINSTVINTLHSTFYECWNLSQDVYDNLITDNVTDMQDAFYDSSIKYFLSHNTSNVRYMGGMFEGANGLRKVYPIDTHNVIDMSYMFFNRADMCSLEELPEFDCSGVIYMDAMFSYYDDKLPKFTKAGGWKNLKCDWNDGYGLKACANLSYQSCINILNGLWDFRANGDFTTTRKLKVHQNFLDIVGDEIIIGTKKGWIITT